MTKTKILGVIAVIAAMSTITLASQPNAIADQGVPDWFKGVASFWAEGGISTAEFLDSVEFLIAEEIIQVPGYGLVSEAQAQGVDQASLDEIWNAIDSLQEQVEVIPTTSADGYKTANLPKESVTSFHIREDTIDFSDIGRNNCDGGDTMVYDSSESEWICGKNLRAYDTYVKANTDKGTAVVTCDRPPTEHRVVGGGGIPSAGATVIQSFPTGSGAFGIPVSGEQPTGWAATSSDPNADVTAFVVCLWALGEY